MNQCQIPHALERIGGNCLQHGDRLFLGELRGCVLVHVGSFDSRNILGPLPNLWLALYLLVGCGALSILRSLFVFCVALMIVNLNHVFYEVRLPEDSSWKASQVQRSVCLTPRRI